MKKILILSGLLSACASEIDNKPAATVEEVKPAPAIEQPSDEKSPAEAEAAPVNSSEWTLSTDSQLEWVGAKVTGDHTGGFQTFTSTIGVDGDQLQSIELSVDMTSVFSDNDKLTGHLRSEDFFEVDKFSTATFKSTGIEEKEIAGSSHLIKGELGMRGITKAIAFPANVSVGEGEVTVAAEFSINRTLWNIVYPGKPDNLIKEDVLIKSKFIFSK